MQTDAYPEPVEGPTPKDLTDSYFEKRTPTDQYAWWRALTDDQRRNLSEDLRLQRSHLWRRTYP